MTPAPVSTSSVTIARLKHLRRLEEASQRYEWNPCPPKVIIAALGKETGTANECVTVRRLELEMAAGHLEVQNVHFFVVPGAPGMILGTRFTREIGFDPPAWVAAKYNELKGININEYNLQPPKGTLPRPRLMADADA